MEIILDFNVISNRDDMFELIKSKLNNEEFYGNNLDALYDVLSYEKEQVKFVISNIKTSDENFNNYIKTLINVLNDLSDVNDNILVELI